MKPIKNSFALLVLIIESVSHHLTLMGITLTTISTQELYYHQHNQFDPSFDLLLSRNCCFHSCVKSFTFNDILGGEKNGEDCFGNAFGKLAFFGNSVSVALVIIEKYAFFIDVVG